MKILALCGSLRAKSLSRALLHAAKVSTPNGTNLHIFEQHGELPLFNPDIESSPPAQVINLWNEVTASDAIVICSPEYAHGITGTMKNTLDWLVGHPPFAYKPVAVLNPSFQSHHADDALKETLRTMSASIVQEACFRIPVIGSGVEPGEFLSIEEFSSKLKAMHSALIAYVQESRQIHEA